MNFDETQTNAVDVSDGAETTLARPSDIPEKFWDSERGEVRTDALVKSYRELERHLGNSIKIPDQDAGPDEISRFRSALGVPETHDGYELELPTDGFEADPEINQRLHAAGFTKSQAQMVYDLAQEYVGPLVQSAAADFEAERQTTRLQQHFGGDVAWQQISRQIDDWGQANLPPAAFTALSTTYEGCIALHKMMQSNEPVLERKTNPDPGINSDELKSMMRDPRYWRDRDPSFIRQVTSGFDRLYRSAEE